MRQKLWWMVLCVGCGGGGDGTGTTDSGDGGFTGSVPSVSALLFLNLLFVVFFVRDPLANPAAKRESDIVRKLIANMISFVKITYVSFWRSGPGPKLGVARVA